MFLIGVDVPGVLGLLGAMLLIAGVLLGVIQGAWLRGGFVVIAFAATVLAYYALKQWDDQPAWLDPVAATSAVVVLALAATVLGAGGRQAPLVAIGALTVLLLAIAAAALLLPDDDGDNGVAFTGLPARTVPSVSPSIAGSRLAKHRACSITVCPRPGCPHP